MPYTCLLAFYREQYFSLSGTQIWTSHPLKELLISFTVSFSLRLFLQVTQNVNLQFDDIEKLSVKTSFTE